MFKLKSAVAVAAALACSAVLASAQAQTAAPARAGGFISPQTTLSINPVLVILGGITGEYEQALTNEFVFAASGTYIPSSSSLLQNDDHYGALDAKLRYYVAGRGPRGLAFGVGLGYVNYNFKTDQPDSRARKGASIGFEVTHNWILGAEQHFMVGTGVGVKRAFTGGRNNDNSDVVPMVRGQAGFAF